MLPKNSTAGSVARIGYHAAKYVNPTLTRANVAVCQAVLSGLSGPMVPPMLQLANQAADMCASNWAKANASHAFLSELSDKDDPVFATAVDAFMSAHSPHHSQESAASAYQGLLEWANMRPAERPDTKTELVQFGMSMMTKMAGCRFEFSEVPELSYGSQIAQQLIPHITKDDEAGKKLAECVTFSRTIGDWINSASVPSLEQDVKNVYPIAAARYGVLSAYATNMPGDTLVTRLARASEATLKVLDSPSLKQRAVEPFISALANQLDDKNVALRAKKALISGGVGNEDASARVAIYQAQALITSILTPPASEAPASSQLHGQNLQRQLDGVPEPVVVIAGRGDVAQH